MRCSIVLNSPALVARPWRRQLTPESHADSVVLRLGPDREGRCATLAIEAGAGGIQFAVLTESQRAGTRPAYPEWYNREHLVVLLNPGHDHATRWLYAVDDQGKVSSASAWVAPGEEPGDSPTRALPSPPWGEGRVRGSATDVPLAATNCTRTLATSLPRHLPKMRSQPPLVAPGPASPCNHQTSGRLSSTGAESAPSAVTRQTNTPGRVSAGMTNLSASSTGWSTGSLTQASAGETPAVRSAAGAPSSNRANSTTGCVPNPPPRSSTVSSGRTGSEAQCTTGWLKASPDVASSRAARADFGFWIFVTVQSPPGHHRPKWESMGRIGWMG